MFRRTFMRLLGGVPFLAQAKSLATVHVRFARSERVWHHAERVTMQTRLPPLKWRKLNEGVTLTKTFTERNPLLDELFTDERSHT